MTPAEHYAEAEACIAEVMTSIRDERIDPSTEWDVSVPLALAQIHAALANVPQVVAEFAAAPRPPTERTPPGCPACGHRRGLHLTDGGCLEEDCDCTRSSE